MSNASKYLRTEIWDNNPTIQKLMLNYKNEINTHNKKHFNSFKPIYGKKKKTKTLLIKIVQMIDNIIRQ